MTQKNTGETDELPNTSKVTLNQNLNRVFEKIYKL